MRLCMNCKHVVEAVRNNIFAFSTLTDPNESEDETNVESSTISKRGKASNKHKKELASSTANSGEKTNQSSSVIYLGHLPTAFEERELLIFLNQFGPVTKCRVSRSTKTGRSRGYAFVQFDDAEVANIVAEAMNGYFLLEKRLVCNVLPQDKVYDLMFKRAKKIMSKKDMQDKAREEVNRRKTPEVMKGITAKLVEREEAKRKKLIELGIDYDFPGYAAGASGNGKAAFQSETIDDKSSKKRRKVSVDDANDKENSDEEEMNLQVKATPKASKKKVSKAKTEVKKDKKKKEKKRKSLA